MQEIRRGRRIVRLVAVVVLTLSGLAAGTPRVAGTSISRGWRTPASGLAACQLPTGAASTVARPEVPAWSATLDREGRITAHSLRLTGPSDVTLQMGSRDFAEPLGTGAFAYGNRTNAGTDLHVLDLEHGCELGAPRVHGWVFGLALDGLRRFLYFSSVSVHSRVELGVWRIALDGSQPEQLVMRPQFGRLHGSTRRSVTLAWQADGTLATSWCTAARCRYASFDPRICSPAACDGAPSTTATVDLPLVSPRPVPVLSDPRWAQNTVLRYRWDAANPPPGSIRPALNAVAGDASSTRRSQAPTYRYDATATDGFRYTEDFPSWSSPDAIANAARSVPDWWIVYIRPEGYQFRWGPMRWCQIDPGAGCFDVERIVLHELGHVVGLDHPERAGFRLRPLDTAMHSTSPARPAPGSRLHAFGPCDTATLQMRYDVASTASHYSTCNNLDTTLVLTASSISVIKDDPVTFVASLRVTDRDAYGRLGGNALSGRIVVLRRRLTGTGEAWQAFGMAAGSKAGTYRLTLNPSASYDYQAAFAAPVGEGLHKAASQVVPVHVAPGCGLPPCISGGSRP